MSIDTASTACDIRALLRKHPAWECDTNRHDVAILVYRPGIGHAAAVACGDSYSVDFFIHGKPSGSLREVTPETLVPVMGRFIASANRNTVIL